MSARGPRADVLDPEQLARLRHERGADLEARRLASGSTPATCATLTTRSRSRIVSLNSRGGTSSIASRRSAADVVEVDLLERRRLDVGRAAEAVEEPQARGDVLVVVDAPRALALLDAPAALGQQRARPRRLDLMAGVAPRAAVVGALGVDRQVELAEDLLERLHEALGHDVALPRRPAAAEQVDRVRDAQDLGRADRVLGAVRGAQHAPAAIGEARDALADEHEPGDRGPQQDVVGERRELGAGDLVAAHHRALE